MKNKNMIITLIGFLVIGFAAVSTALVLNGTIGIGVNVNDYDVIFTSAIIDGEESSNVVISEDKKKITFASNKLITLNEISVLDYKVKNNSTQYGADVTISCNTDGNEYVSITGEFDGKVIPLTEPITIEAQEVKNGSITAKLVKTFTGEDDELSIVCEINGTATSKSNSNYTINFDSGGGSMVSDKVVSSDGTYGELPVPEKEDYVFLGWYTEDGIKITSDSNVELNENSTVNAKWALDCPLEIGTTWTFDYKGTEDVFDVPCDATYKLETWGAQGGAATTTYIGGYGGYSRGDVEFAYQDQLFINVGGAGKSNGQKKSLAGGYNGGGSVSANTSVNHEYGSGGGATHIAKVSGLLSTLSNKTDQLLIVSGAGGGGRYQSNTSTGIYGAGGHGGGYVGSGGTVHGGWTATSEPGSQTKAGSGASFGTGGSVNAQGGGGAGYYGGSAGGSGAGGSGYIGNPLLTNKVMYCYNCSESNEESTKTISTTKVSSTPTSEYAKSGNGYARITLVGLPY